MDQESANYLTSDSSFNVILNSETLESFVSPIPESEILEDINLNNLDSENNIEGYSITPESTVKSNQIKPPVVQNLKVVIFKPLYQTVTKSIFF